MTVLKQISVVLVGLVLAGVMVSLGIWQLSVYQAQGRDQAEERAAAPAVALTAVAPPGQEVGDAYGRTVRFSGQYDPGFQTFIAIPDQPGSYRVLTAFRLTGGGAVPVVRGVVRGKQAPTPPSKTLTQTGVLLPPEGTDRQGEPGAEPSTVALASLAQQWKVQLVNGYATLNAAESRAQSLAPTEARLPSSHGRLRNGFYALQWWVFAGFAVLMAVRMARDLGQAAHSPDAGSFDGTAPDSTSPANTSAERASSAEDTSSDRDVPDEGNTDRDSEPAATETTTADRAPTTGRTLDSGPAGTEPVKPSGPDTGALPSPT